ncbi:MAG: ABC transporter ATP-binding protein, partial [Caldilineaceae bacterium]|nr:ABC transporter ATP-binding protein [Caldilineaceae bacterium]
MASQTNRENQESKRPVNGETATASDAAMRDDPEGNKNLQTNTEPVGAAAEIEPSADVKRFRPNVDDLPPPEDHNPEDSVTEMTTDEELSQDTALFELLASSLRPYWRSVTVAALLMLAVAGMNVIPPYLVQQAIDGPIATGDMQGLWRITIFYGITALALFVVTFAYTYYLQFAAQRALADLRTRLFDHIFRQDYAFLTGTSTGDLVSRLSSDIDNINQVLSSSIVVILVEGLTFVVIMWVMFATNWRLALIAIIVMPILAIVTRYFRQRIRRSSSGERRAMALISSFLNEHLHGMTVVQLFGREGESEEEFDAYNSTYRQ